MPLASTTVNRLKGEARVPCDVVRLDSAIAPSRSRWSLQVQDAPTICVILVLSFNLSDLMSQKPIRKGCLCLANVLEMLGRSREARGLSQGRNRTVLCHRRWTCQGTSRMLSEVSFEKCRASPRACCHCLGMESVERKPEYCQR